jgi:hypothetical protein
MTKHYDLVVIGTGTAALALVGAAKAMDRARHMRMVSGAKNDRDVTGALRDGGGRCREMCIGLGVLNAQSE